MLDAVAKKKINSAKSKPTARIVEQNGKYMIVVKRDFSTQAIWTDKEGIEKIAEAIKPYAAKPKSNIL